MSVWHNFLVTMHVRDPQPVLPPAPVQIATDTWVQSQRDLLAAKLRAEEAVAEVDMLEKRVARLAQDRITLGETQ